MMNDFTIVLGVDANHIPHLQESFPNWLDMKPSLAKRPVVIFYDGKGPDACEYFDLMADAVLEHPNVTFIPWPPRGTEYEDDPTSRFGRAQRYKMLAGFVHVPAMVVTTPYWLKLDLDVVATGRDAWIDESWFDKQPAIIASPWGYTKPPDQMDKLDRWVENNKETMPVVARGNPVNLHPRPDASCVKHSRMISWCAFFNTNFTKFCSNLASNSCGEGRMPVPSQDGYMWYIATRCQVPIVTVTMKWLGWAHCSGLSSIRSTIQSLPQEVESAEL